MQEENCQFYQGFFSSSSFSLASKFIRDQSQPAFHICFFLSPPQTCIALFALLAVVAADQGYAPAPQYKDEPANYAYNYAVADSYSGVNFGQNENRNGYATNGEYRVQLPDGRTQIVTYTVADAYSGYVADVRYEGEAKYPSEPAYKPKPQYS